MRSTPKAEVFGAWAFISLYPHSFIGLEDTFCAVDPSMQGPC